VSVYLGVPSFKRLSRGLLVFYNGLLIVEVVDVWCPEHMYSSRVSKEISIREMEAKQISYLTK
jgi:hypothetical protein